MPETLTREQRSRTMAAVKSRDTTPELIVREVVHRLGFRFRLHRRDLPGTPDIVLPRLRKVINVHGCFWHMHSCRHARRAPVNNREYWKRKRENNVARDKRARRLLKQCGWSILTIWECETKNREALANRVSRFLNGTA